MSTKNTPQITMGAPSQSPPDHQVAKGIGGAVNPSGLNQYNVGQTTPDQPKVVEKPKAGKSDEGKGTKMASGTVRTNGQQPLLQQIDNENAAYFVMGQKPKHTSETPSGTKRDDF